MSINRDKLQDTCGGLEFEDILNFVVQIVEIWGLTHPYKIGFVRLS